MKWHNSHVCKLPCTNALRECYLSHYRPFQQIRVESTYPHPLLEFTLHSGLNRCTAQATVKVDLMNTNLIQRVNENTNQTVVRPCAAQSMA